MRRRNDETGLFEIVKHNWRTGEVIEALPPVRGREMAEKIREMKQRGLTDTEKEQGIAWYIPDEPSRGQPLKRVRLHNGKTRGRRRS